MNIEYEATFGNIDKEHIRSRLRQSGAHMVQAEFLQKRKVFHPPAGHEIPGGWLRVRNEGTKITMALKVVKNNATIEDQHECEVKVDNFDEASSLLTSIGCREKSYQENLRERWEMDGVEITIDEWPFLEPLVEIEGISEEAVRMVSDKLGFNYDEAYFGAVDGLYAEKYGIDEEIINNRTPLILFDMEENPFLL